MSDAQARMMRGRAEMDAADAELKSLAIELNTCPPSEEEALLARLEPDLRAFWLKHRAKWPRGGRRR
jgi:hypothetical protein